MGPCYTNLIHPINNNPYQNHICNMQRPKPTKENYYDQQFRNNSQSISDDYNRFKIGVDFEWKRELESDLYLQDFQSKNILKGKLNDDYFLEALQYLTDLQHDILKRLFITKQKSERYEVYINICGEWNIVTVDNFFLYKQGQPIFTHHKLNDPWVMILEKAFAKIYGYYTKLEKSGIKYEIMKDLTGCPYLLNMDQDDQVFDTKISNKDNFEFAFNPDSYLITHSLPIIRNKNSSCIIEMDVQINSFIYLTLSQSDLKLNSNNHYAQLTLIVGRKDEKGQVYEKYGQIRDLTLKLKDIQGEYVIYVEVFWQEHTDYKLNLQSYGNNSVKFKDSKSNPKSILDKLIYTHSLQKQVNYIENLQYRESKIGRYYYSIYKNNAKDQIIQVTFNIQKSLISICLPHNDFIKTLNLKPGQTELIKFQILLENEKTHNFKFEKQKNIYVIKSLTDQEFKFKCFKTPTKIIERNSQIKIYEYSDEHQAGFLFHNLSDQKYSESRIVKMKNLYCRDMNNQNVINIEVLPNEERLLRFDIIDWNIEKYELEQQVKYKFE